MYSTSDSVLAPARPAPVAAVLGRSARERRRDHGPSVGGAAKLSLPGGVAATLRLSGAAAVLNFNSGACTGWAAEAPDALAETLAEIGRRPGVEAVVLRGPRLFDGGGVGGREPALHPLLRAIAESPAPVLALIEGDAVGPGLELALACTGRLAERGARFSLPGIHTGRLPVNGAVQHLPLLVGFPEAARMIALGESLDAAAALRIGLLDALEVADPVAFALSLPADRPRWGRRHLTAAERSRAAADLLGAAKGVRRDGLGPLAPLAALRAIEAVIGLSERRATVETLRAAEKLESSEEAHALRYATTGADALARSAELASNSDVITAQVRWPLLREAVHLLDEGATPAQVDRCLLGYGFAEGPFAESDRMGLAAVFPQQEGEGGRRWLSYSPTLDLMADGGRVGGPGTAGWYQASETHRLPHRADPGLERLLQESAMFQRIHRHPLDDEIVLRRCLNAIVEGGAVLISEGLGAPALDAIWTTRLGFPRWKGGPLFQAGLDAARPCAARQ